LKKAVGLFQQRGLQPAAAHPPALPPDLIEGAALRFHRTVHWTVRHLQAERSFFLGLTLWESVGCEIIFLRKAVRGKNGFDFISPSAEGETLRGLKKGGSTMKTWNDYKAYVRETDPAAARDLDEAEAISQIVGAVVARRTEMGLTQRELAAQCGIPQSSVARMESCKTTPNLGTLLNICHHLGLQVQVIPAK
jgi:DNA-binding XRE family transcriptional regulator